MVDAELMARDTVEHMQRLNVQDGDTLVVRLKRSVSLSERHALSDHLRELLGKRGLQGVQMLFLEAGVEIESLSPAQMREHGWERLETP